MRCDESSVPSLLRTMKIAVTRWDVLFYILVNDGEATSSIILNEVDYFTSTGDFFTGFIGYCV